MLHFREPGPHSRSRRNFLSVGTLGLGGLSLPSMLQAAGANPKLLKDRSVIFLFMHGGPSQFETFDPKMDAPSGIRSVTGEMATSLPGVTFGSTFPKLASLAHKLAIVRSFTTEDGTHDIKPIVGKNSLGANLGSSLRAGRRDQRSRDGHPAKPGALPPSGRSGGLEAVRQFGDFTATGHSVRRLLRSRPEKAENSSSDLSLNLSPQRFADRRLLLGELDAAQRWFDDGGAEGMSRFQQQAFDTVLKGVANAFDLSRENPRTLARYDTAPLVRPDSIRTIWANHERYRDHGQTLGSSSSWRAGFASTARGSSR